MIKFKGAICSSCIWAQNRYLLCCCHIETGTKQSLKLVVIAYTIHLLSEKIKLHIQAFDKVGQILKIADSRCFIHIKQ